MLDRWIIRVDGKEYGPVDVEVLREWKREGRLLPANEARLEADSRWSNAGAIPGLFQIEPPEIQTAPTAHQSSVTGQESGISDKKLGKRPRARNILTETFQIYFRGFFQFLGLTLLITIPRLSSQLTSATVQSASNVNIDLRTLLMAAFSVGMFVCWLVLWPVYVAAIQILSLELTAGRRVSLLGILNHAVKYWPRVAGLCIFVNAIFGLIIAFGIAVLLMMLAGAMSGSLVSILFGLGLAIFQIWLFARVFINFLFWQQFAVLENSTATDALRASRNLARSGTDLAWYQRPLWRAAIIVSVWYAIVIAIDVMAYWPKFVAEWPLIQDYYNQLISVQDPQAILQKMIANVPPNPAISFWELGWSTFLRILQPLLGIAFVVLYLDSKGYRDSESSRASTQAD